MTETERLLIDNLERLHSLDPSVANNIGPRAAATIRRLTAERDAYEAALRTIAALDDHSANEYLARRGSYGAFDEPGSVQTARSTLAAYTAYLIDGGTNP